MAVFGIAASSSDGAPVFDNLAVEVLEVPEALDNLEELVATEGATLEPPE